MTTTRLNPIEALLADLTGMPPEDAVACGNWARLNASAATVARHGMVVTVDPAVLAAAARRHAAATLPHAA